MLDLGRTFLQSVERSPRQVAIVDGGLRLSYLEWARRIGAVQRGLADAGLARGDHLLVVLQNRWEMATLHWACQFAGIVMTPLNWRAKPEEIDYCLVDAEAKAIVWEPVADAAVAASCAASQALRIGVGEVHGAT
ncbi:MAG: AMP-binding protein, partial [Proteobacteria bacterium]|nr:AMP-binding protein [Pseudomonadota bacterium]